MKKMRFSRKDFIRPAIIFFAVVFLLSAGIASAQQRAMKGLLAENVLDMDIRTTNGKDIGDIADVLFNRKGKIQDFIVEIGGFLGIGEKRVAISPKELQYNTEQGYAVYPGTRQDLEDKPDVNYHAYGYGRGYYPYGPYYGYYSRPPYPYDPYYYDYYNRYGNRRPMSRGYYGREHQGEEYNGGMRGQVPGGMHQGMRSPNGREYQGEEYNDRMRRQSPGGMHQQDMRSRNDRYQDRQEQRQMSRYGGMQWFGGNILSMNAILDADVRTRNGNIVGDIDNLVISRRGRITYAIIDIGGFLGIGEKPVAVPFDKLENLGPYFVLYPGTEKQLDSLPEFDKSRLVGVARIGNGNKQQKESAQPAEKNQNQQQGG